MKNIGIIIVVIGLALAAARPASATQPGNARSFVSPTGSDANNCTLAAPCRTFAHAITSTNAGGEIAVLGTAGYGVLTIDKAISIVNPGGFEAGIAVPSGATGITITAGNLDAVSLRGLTIEGGGVGAVGILFNSGQSLTIEDCVVRHMAGSYPQGTGIEFVPNAASTLSVSNSLASDNASHGIVVNPSGSGNTHAVVDRVQANNNAFGLFVGGDLLPSSSYVFVTVSDSVVASNINVGVYAKGQVPGGTGVVNIFHSVVANNAFGVQALPGGTISLAQSTLTGNDSGYDANHIPGVIYSYGDNYIDFNFDTKGSLTTVSKQ
jgi:hypothetical protein